jgi:broad specificity phosphatase PhoE
MKSHLPFWGLFVLVIPLAVLGSPPQDQKSSALKDAVVMIIRHAEKPHDGSNLSSTGKARAKAYVDYFKGFTIDGRPLKPDYIFATADSTNSRRPGLTVEPVARELGLTIDSRFSNQQFPALAREIQTRPHGTNILICWHHGKIPQLLRALGADPKKLLPNGKWPDDEFGWLIELRYDENGHLIESRRISESLSPSGSGKPAPGAPDKSLPPHRGGVISTPNPDKNESATVKSTWKCGAKAISAG